MKILQVCRFIVSVHDKHVTQFVWPSLNLSTRKAQGGADGRGLEERGGGRAEVLWAASKGSRVVAVTADWLMESVSTQCRRVVVIAVVMEMGQLCCRRVPPGPWWSGRALCPGSGSGL